MWRQLVALPTWVLPLMLFMSLLSWLVESKKWQFLVRDLYGLRFRESVTQNLTAQAASYITPLRSGEFVAKALFFPPELRKEITQRVFVGNYSQMAVTLLLGCSAIGFHDIFDLNLSMLYGLAIMLVMLVFFIGYRWVSKKVKINQLSAKLWSLTLFLSLIRYLIFATNWLIIFYGLGFENALGSSTIVNIAVFYLAVSVIPMIQLLDMPVRWSIVGVLFAGVDYGLGTVVLATTVVWLTNSVFPTLLGCALLPFKRFNVSPT
jgi:hypothetical protein